MDGFIFSLSDQALRPLRPLNDIARTESCKDAENWVKKVCFDWLLVEGSPSVQAIWEHILMILA
jgi:hypothetical protein